MGLSNVSPLLARHLPNVARAWVRATDLDRAHYLTGEVGEQRAARVVVRDVITRVGGELVPDVLVGSENIDLIAVLPVGVFILEVKHWSGTATLKDNVIFHGGRQPRRVHAQAERQRAKLAELLQLDVAISGVIVLVPNGVLTVKGAPAPDTTPVVRVEQLTTFLVGPRDQPRPRVLADHEVGGIATWIRNGGPVRLKVHAHPDMPTPTPEPGEPAVPGCPRCSEPMVERQSKRGAFLGCSRFPACRGTRDLQGGTGRR